MKTLLIILALTVTALAIPEPNCMSDYNDYITYVDFIDHEDNNFFQTCWGICYTSDWPDFPIEIRIRQGLDFLFAPSLEFTIDHEKAHRFEAVIFSNDTEKWLIFEESFENLTHKIYDEEVFANTYARIRQRGINTSLDWLVYQFIYETP